VNEELIKAVEIVVAQATAKATEHTLAELARVQAERDRWTKAFTTAAEERDAAIAECARLSAQPMIANLAQVQTALDKLHATWAERDRLKAQLVATIAVRRDLILDSLRTHFADKVKAVETTRDGGYMLNAAEIDELVRDLANNCTQAAFMIDDDAPGESTATPIGDLRTAGHSPRVVIDTIGSAPRVDACTCGLKFTGQDTDSEYAAHVAAVAGISQATAAPYPSEHANGGALNADQRDALRYPATDKAK
jgi:hypothetical protein